MTARPNLKDHNDLLAFLDYLDALRVWYRLERTRRDGITVLITLVGTRIEVYFLEDRIEYSIFSGSESVANDLASLLDRIEQDVS